MAQQFNQLYQELILEHSRFPRNKGQLEVPPAISRIGSNPLCGDKLILYVHMDNNLIKDIKFDGEGCALFTSACSLLSETLKGKTSEYAHHFLSIYIKLLTDKESLNEENCEILAKLNVFEGVKNYPVRVKCAALFARTLQNIIENPDHNETIINLESD